MTTRKCRPTDTVSVARDVSSREFDGEWVVLDLRQGSYFGLDATGGLIWSHLTRGLSPAEIAQLLAAGYDTGESTLLGDVMVLVDELVARDLVRLNE
jgi:hypothetical protein